MLFRNKFIQTKFLAKFSFVFLISFFIFQQNKIFAQKNKIEWRILKTDTAGFPLLTTTIELTGRVQPIKGDFNLQDESGKKLEIRSFEKKGKEKEGEATQNRLIYLLIDASPYADGIPIKNFKSASVEALGQLTGDDLLNVGYFGNDAQGSVTHFGQDFSNNIGGFENDIKNRIVVNADSSANYIPDAFKAIYEAMDKMKKSNKDGQKILIVLSGAMGGGKHIYKREDIQERAKKLNITIHTLNFRINDNFAPEEYKMISDRTDGLTSNASNIGDIKNAMGDFLESRSKKTTEDATQRYIITFEVPNTKDGLEHSYKISYAGKEESVLFTAPNAGGTAGEKGNWTMVYIIIGLIILALILALMYWQYNESRLRKLEEEEAQAEEEAQKQAQIAKKEKEHQAKLRDLEEKNIRLQEQLKFKEKELAQKPIIEDVPTVVPPSKFDPKKTQIGAGGGSSPMLQVIAGAFNKNFRLNKPTMTVGRGAMNDIIVPEQTVSTQHATITIENGSFYINDLDSTNGTFVNGSRVDKQLLKAGDLIKMGGANAKFDIG